jgi:hypothetical protein
VSGVMVHVVGSVRIRIDFGLPSGRQPNCSLHEADFGWNEMMRGSRTKRETCFTSLNGEEK